MTGIHQNPMIMTVTVLVAGLLAVSAIVGLVAWRSIYAKETDALVDSVAAQDVTSLVVAALLPTVALVVARTSSALAALCLAGVFAFVAYNAAIYCFSVHFGPLFLVWTAVLGLSVLGVVLAGNALDRTKLIPLLDRTPSRFLAWVLIVAAALFALLWLKEIVPDLIAGRPSTSAAQWQVPTNPVHVLDLAIYLPLSALAGVMILRAEPLGLQVGVPLLVWLILTCLPILSTPAMALARGHVPAWGAVLPIAVLLVVFLLAGALLLGEARSL